MRRRRALTLTALVVPVTLLVAVSLAVIVWLPAVLSVTVKVPVPLVNVLLAGNAAWCRCWSNDTVPL